jgi:hypothetical protein
MLSVIDMILPMGPDEWEMVADSHSSEFPEMNREANSLRRKFQSLYNQKIPTGDPHCPPHVRKAKRIRYSIEARADSSNMMGPSGAADLGFDDDTGHEVAGEEFENHDNAADGGNNTRDDNGINNKNLVDEEAAADQGDNTLVDNDGNTGRTEGEQATNSDSASRTGGQRLDFEQEAQRSRLPPRPPHSTIRTARPLVRSNTPTSGTAMGEALGINFHQLSKSCLV